MEASDCSEKDNVREPSDLMDLLVPEIRKLKAFLFQAFSLLRFWKQEYCSNWM